MSHASFIQSRFGTSLYLWLAALGLLGAVIVLSTDTSGKVVPFAFTVFLFLVGITGYRFPLLRYPIGALFSFLLMPVGAIATWQNGLTALAVAPVFFLLPIILLADQLGLAISLAHLSFFAIPFLQDLEVDMALYSRLLFSSLFLIVGCYYLVRFASVQLALSSDREARLLQKSKELMESNQAKSRFLANMSHELRTPLNAIFGSLQVIRGSLQDQGSVARYTNVAMQSYHSVIDIVNDVLDLSKLAENKVEIYPEPSNVDEIVSLVASEMRAVALNKGIALSATCSPELASQTRLIDRTRLTQVLRNFLSNAVKFTNSGSVALDAQVGNDAEEVVFTITDTGVGIPEDKLSAIFEPFEQVESSRAIERNGTGLGLPIAKRLVELMGGSITLKSTVGEGTTFTVLLRLPQTSLARTDKRASIDTSMLQPARILLADDVMTNRMIFSALLKDCPYTIDEVENGELAVEIALSGDYDLVFLDIQMPVMDGLSALHALKTVDYPKPIIACTANVMKEDVAQYLDAGFDSVIGKPFLEEDLVACIQAAVTRKNVASSDR